MPIYLKLVLDKLNKIDIMLVEIEKTQSGG
jgi:hypothetical protein